MIDRGFILSVLNRWSIWRNSPIIVCLPIILDCWESCSHDVHPMAGTSLGKVSILIIQVIRLTCISMSVLYCSAWIKIRWIRILWGMSGLHHVIRPVSNWLKIKDVSLDVWELRIRCLPNPAISICRKRWLHCDLCFWFFLLLIIT